MKKFIGLIAALTMLAASLLIAQEADDSQLYAHPPIRISDRPQNPDQPVGILPAQFKAAYGFNRIPNHGEGQTIAIVDAYDDPNLESDVAFYTEYFHLGSCPFQKVQIGSPTDDTVWGLEESLDIEQACALVPQANIILVEAPSTSHSDLLGAVQVAYSAPYNATVVSMSWGFLEFSSETGDDSLFCNVVNGNGQPVTFVAASGDTGHGDILYPSASRCVIAAGGTVLTLSTVLPPPNPLQLNYGIETAWPDGVGGISMYEFQESWQNPACCTWSTTNRCIPYIASVADNIPVYDTYGFPGWNNVEGTSITAPDWASFFTLVNSLRAGQGKGTLSQGAQDLYAIYYSSNYLNNFHDITTGSNGNCGSECNAGPGYDLVTGIGSYRSNVLAPALVADPN